MDGTIAQLDKIRALCDRYGALLGIDECHATGFLGARGRGTHEHRGVFGKIDIITGTLGKALGGASGGFTTGKKEVIELLRQRSRPVPVLQHADAGDRRRARWRCSTCSKAAPSCATSWPTTPRGSAQAITEAGFEIKPGEHPIVPIMIGDAVKAQQLARSACSSWACTRSASSSRSCPRARRASACR